MTSQARSGWWLNRVAEENDLLAFHQGTRRALEEIYREHYDTVDRAVGVLVSGADRETVVHEVFFRLLSRPEVRRSFQGGSLGGWLSTMARNSAIDFLRRHRRETPVPPDVAAGLDSRTSASAAEQTELALLIEVFCRDHLPADWRPVFRARFLDDLSQQEAARALGLARTTIAYRELRIRSALRRFLLREGVR